MVPFVSGLDSFPVSPLILGYFCFNDPSMWSNERFSIMSTTMCFRLSNPADIHTPQRISEFWLFSADSASELRNVTSPEHTNCITAYSTLFSSQVRISCTHGGVNVRI